MGDTDGFRIEVKGLKELDARLQEISSLAQKEAALAFCRTAAGTIARAARQKVNVRTGQLKKDIRIFRHRNVSSGQFRYWVGSGKKGWYGLLLERGTAPHIIRALRAKSLGRDGHLGKEVKHPGAKPYPWLKPAFDENWQNALEAGRRKYERIVEKKERSSNGGGE